MIHFGFTGKAEGDMLGDVPMGKFLHRKFSFLEGIVRPKQVHKDHVEAVGASEGFMRIPETDGLITSAKNMALTVITADCVPAVFYDESKGLIAISHQGWKGCLAHLPGKMISEMIKAGSEVEDISVGIGPAIGACCYEIESDRAELFRNEFPKTKAVTEIEGRFYLSLTELVYEQLITAGVAQSDITYTIDCTSCREDKYYSYRKSPIKTAFPEQLSYIIQE